MKGKVFGIGLSRTGTMSLSSALNRIGLRSVHFPHDAATRAEITEFINGRTAGPRLSILAQADAITDTPVTIAFEELDVMYPGSKFVLTVRDVDEWLQSCEDFWRLEIDRQRWAKPRSPVSIYAGEINRVLYGTEAFDLQRFRRVKSQFERRVRDYFRDRGNDLLVVDICGGQGWAEICGFLGTDVPTEPFPHVHKRDIEA